MLFKWNEAYIVYENAIDKALATEAEYKLLTSIGIYFVNNL